MLTRPFASNEIKSELRRNRQRPRDPHIRDSSLIFRFAYQQRRQFRLTQPLHLLEAVLDFDSIVHNNEMEPISIQQSAEKEVLDREHPSEVRDLPHER